MTSNYLTIAVIDYRQLVYTNACVKTSCKGLVALCYELLSLFSCFTCLNTHENILTYVFQLLTQQIFINFYYKYLFKYPIQSINAYEI